MRETGHRGCSEIFPRPGPRWKRSSRCPERSREWRRCAPTLARGVRSRQAAGRRRWADALRTGGNTHRRRRLHSRTGCKRASITSYVMRRAEVHATEIGRATIDAMRGAAICVWLLLASAADLLAAKNLEIYFIDVEGGQSTLFVAPSGESLLMDTGFAGFNGRDASRIVAAAKTAGVKKIDYLVISHYHADHVGGLPGVAAKLPILNFVDHGPNTETDKDSQVRFNMYRDFAGKANRITVKPGDTIPVKNLEVQVLAAAAKTIAAPLPGAGQA